MGRGVKTTELLKECLSDALIRLMQEKPFDKISANEIALTAEVHRSTWFRNFSSKQEALTFKFIRLWNRWSTKQDIDTRDGLSPEIIRMVFQFCYENRSTLRVVYSADMQTTIYDAFYRIMDTHRQSDTEDSYSIHFCCYGLWGLVDEWLYQGCKQSPAEMAKIYSRVLCNMSKLQDISPRNKNIERCGAQSSSKANSPKEVLT